MKVEQAIEQGINLQFFPMLAANVVFRVKHFPECVPQQLGTPRNSEIPLRSLPLDQIQHGIRVTFETVPFPRPTKSGPGRVKRIQ